MTWPVDKLSIIDEALALTGNEGRAVADDGSDEWNTASAAYEAALPYAIEGGDWKFATTIVTLQPSAVAVEDDLYSTAYAKPVDLLHLIWVRLSDRPVDYKIIDNRIELNATGESADGATPGVVTIKYVRAPSMDRVTPTFAMALRAFVMSGIYRGLHEDADNADKQWAFGEGLLGRAKTRSDQEQPKRAMFNSRIRAARRVRRPYPRTPAGWGGTGSPS